MDREMPASPGINLVLEEIHCWLRAAMVVDEDERDRHNAAAGLIAEARQQLKPTGDEEADDE